MRKTEALSGVTQLAVKAYCWPSYEQHSHFASSDCVRMFEFAARFVRLVAINFGS